MSSIEDAALEPKAEVWLEIVRQQVTTLQFGVVQITVHDCEVVQAERTEKVRIVRPVPRRNLTVDHKATGGPITNSGH